MSGEGKAVAAGMVVLSQGLLQGLQQTVYKKKKPSNKIYREIKGYVWIQASHVHRVYSEMQWCKPHDAVQTTI